MGLWEGWGGAVGDGKGGLLCGAVEGSRTQMGWGCGCESRSGRVGIVGCGEESGLRAFKMWVCRGTEVVRSLHCSWSGGGG